ncbi:MAG: hypothetical protein AAB438_03655 [Patescibacteria group bacterium]
MNIKLFFFPIFLTLAILACKKEPASTVHDCYNIPATTNLSTVNLVGKNVTIEWSTSDGRGGTFDSKITVERPVNVSGTSKTHQFLVNGYLTNTGLVAGFLDSDNPLVVIVVHEDTTKNENTFFALRPILFGTKGSSAWNTSIPSPTGVLETASEIEITANSMQEPNGDPVAMCMKVVLQK